MNEKGEIPFKKLFLVTTQQQTETVCSNEIHVKIKIVHKFHIHIKEFKMLP